MDRRKSLKLLATGALASPIALSGCKTSPDDESTKTEPTFNLDRSPDEIILEKKILSQEKFFTAHELATITVLVDIIIPKDEKSGSASEAGVPAFLEFIVKDMPEHQTPLRGGLKWLDLQMFKNYEKPFIQCAPTEQIALIDQIAFPEKAPKNLKQGVSFFTLLRNLTATGFYTSEIGVKDLEYMGNQPNQWNGVPKDVLEEFKISYSEKDEEVCIKYDTKA
ncbi:MAG: gluconate 2-dehydrogenase subunit 3 family protein [Chitinophagaceae bacterium]|nr:gluconate 2-dehydrogenase subunit 3 family protein [Chitinophagaceae bacterium]